MALPLALLLAVSTVAQNPTTAVWTPELGGLPADSVRMVEGSLLIFVWFTIAALKRIRVEQPSAG